MAKKLQDRELRLVEATEECGLKVAVFGAYEYDRHYLNGANQAYGFDLTFYDARLSSKTASLAAGFPVVCLFTNDCVDRHAADLLHTEGVKLIVLRCAGFNQIDLQAVAEKGIKVLRVPEYSPYSVAEYAVGMILCLNRKYQHSYQRVRELDFSLRGLLGFDLHGKTVGLIGTGRIGATASRILHGFGCRILAFDTRPQASLVEQGVLQYVSLDELYAESRIISLHVPLVSDTFHLIDETAMRKMQDGVMIINTGRGKLIDTRALIAGLKSGRIGSAGLDVYEEEEGIFFSDLSQDLLKDDVLARLLTFPNVLITSHQGFFTQEALENIASTTMLNIQSYVTGSPTKNEVQWTPHGVRS